MTGQRPVRVCGDRGSGTCGGSRGRGGSARRIGGGRAGIKLRDVDQDIWNVDTVYILSSRVDDDALARLARRWRADDVSWLSHSDASELLGESDPQHHRRVLLVWWD